MKDTLKVGIFIRPRDVYRNCRIAKVTTDYSQRERKMERERESKRVRERVSEREREGERTADRKRSPPV